MSWTELSPSALLLEARDDTLFITLNRPQARNAMSLKMVDEIMAVFSAIENDPAIRTVVFRGAEGHFCAGGDIKDMAMAGEPPDGPSTLENDKLAQVNRRFGDMLLQVNHAPQAVVALLEGVVLGGGFGLACVSDVALCLSNCRFGLPETSLGVIPAQIAPFIVQRLGMTQARRLAVTGGRFDGQVALQIGLVHQSCNDTEALEAALAETLVAIDKCAPSALRQTKALVMSLNPKDLSEALDQAAVDFAMAARSAEGMEGFGAFIEKRPASWQKK